MRHRPSSEKKTSGLSPNFAGAAASREENAQLDAVRQFKFDFFVRPSHVIGPLYRQTVLPNKLLSAMDTASLEEEALASKRNASHPVRTTHSLLLRPFAHPGLRPLFRRRRRPRRRPRRSARRRPRRSAKQSLIMGYGFQSSLSLVVAASESNKSLNIRNQKLDLACGVTSLRPKRTWNGPLAALMEMERTAPHTLFEAFVYSGSFAALVPLRCYNLRS